MDYKHKVAYRPSVPHTSLSQREAGLDTGSGVGGGSWRGSGWKGCRGSDSRRSGAGLARVSLSPSPWWRAGCHGGSSTGPRQSCTLGTTRRGWRTPRAAPPPHTWTSARGTSATRSQSPVREGLHVCLQTHSPHKHWRKRFGEKKKWKELNH